MVSEYVSGGRVEGGRLQLRNKRAFDTALAKFKDGEVLVTIERAHATRSDAQNRYLWAVVIDLIADHTGFTPDETHECLKAKFLPKKLAFADGNGVVVDEYVIGGSTRKLNKVEFGEYIEAIRTWAAEYLGVVIPDPVEQW